MVHLGQYIVEHMAMTTKVGDVKVDNDVFTKCFECDLARCKGICCASGLQGALLAKGEDKILEEILPEVEQYMTEEAIAKINEDGIVSYDGENNPCTQIILNPDKRTSTCVFAIKENGCTKCAIQKAFVEGNSKLKSLNFPKPQSCHLWPLTTNIKSIEYNTDKRCICKKNANTPIYVTQEDALVRVFGEEWYRQLTELAKTI